MNPYEPPIEAKVVRERLSSLEVAWRVFIVVILILLLVTIVSLFPIFLA